MKNLTHLPCKWSMSHTFAAQLKGKSEEEKVTTTYTEWSKKMYTLFTHQYLWNKFK